MKHFALRLPFLFAMSLRRMGAFHEDDDAFILPSSDSESHDEADGASGPPATRPPANSETPANSEPPATSARPAASDPPATSDQPQSIDFVVVRPPRRGPVRDRSRSPNLFFLPPRATQSAEVESLMRNMVKPEYDAFMADYKASMKEYHMKNSKINPAVLTEFAFLQSSMREKGWMVHTSPGTSHVEWRRAL